MDSGTLKDSPGGAMDSGALKASPGAPRMDWDVMDSDVLKASPATPGIHGAAMESGAWNDSPGCCCGGIKQGAGPGDAVGSIPNGAGKCRLNRGDLKGLDRGLGEDTAAPCDEPDLGDCALSTGSKFLCVAVCLCVLLEAIDCVLGCRFSRGSGGKRRD